MLISSETQPQLDTEHTTEINKAKQCKRETTKYKQNGGL